MRKKVAAMAATALRDRKTRLERSVTITSVILAE
jgi:hypothetical protein